MKEHASPSGKRDQNGNNNCNKKRKPFKPNYDYEVDYNDHFETPIEAYTDILPMLDLLAPTSASNKSGEERRKTHVIYDPYYCNGRTKTILRGLGFQKIEHEKRDFYKDVRDGSVPRHHTLVTNPPYSDDHKEKCLEFCVKQFREQRIAFFLLIPNYVAARNYYRRILGDTIHDVAYLVPGSEYSYSHPEGTGHEKSPFESLWFCCIGKEKIQKLAKKDSCYRNNNNFDDGNKANPNGRPKFVASFEDLVSQGVISLQKRPNPRQRKKMRKLAAQSVPHSETTAPIARPRFNQNKGIVKNSKEKAKGKKRSTNSKYRNKTGERVKKRF